MYRILTERKRENQVKRILDNYFDAYTLYAATGRWKGKNESTLVAEIASASKAKIRQAAEDIKRLNKQDAVLMQHILAKGELV